MKHLITLLAVALLTIRSVAQTGPEQLRVSISGGSLQQRPATVIIGFSATGNNAFTSDDTTSLSASNALLTAQLDTTWINNSAADSSVMVPVFDSINNINSYIDTTILTSMPGSGNMGSNILPYVISSDNFIIDKFDSRPAIDRDKIYNFGIASDRPDTITISAASFFDTTSASTSNNTQISFVYLEDIATGLFYPILNQNITLAIPADTTFALNYRLHIMVKAGITTLPVTSIGGNDGTISIENPFSNSWQYIIYDNGTPVYASLVSNPDTSQAGFTSQYYSVSVYVNNLLADSEVVFIGTTPPLMNHGPNMNAMFSDPSGNSYDATARKNDWHDPVLTSSAQKITLDQDGNTQHLQVTFLNANGQLIGFVSSAEPTMSFDVPVAGIYIVMIRQENGEIISKKIMIN
jgi:hypothetical protein